MSFVVPKKSLRSISAGLVLAVSVATPLPYVHAQANRASQNIQVPVVPGDVLSVSVANHPEMSSDSLMVAETGRIALPVVGSLSVAGKSVAQIQKLVTAAYKTQLLQPRVTVTVVKAKQRAVYFSGSAIKPGMLELQPGWRISEAVAAYGGLPISLEDISTSLIRNGEAVRVDLASVNANPGGPSDVLLRSGDTLRLEMPAGRAISITGDVKAPGPQVLRRNRRLVDAIVAAGGLAQAPEITEVTLIRAGRRQPLNVEQAFSSPASPSNIDLHNGDTLVVKAVRTVVSVVSFNDLVQNSGTFTLDGRPTVLRALLAAGGAKVPPKQLVASIRRGEQSIPVDLDKAGQDPKFDLTLREGDVLLVSPPAGPAVHITGSVTKPGDLYLQKEGTLLDAIVAAGGLAGKPSEVRLSVMRKSGDRTIILSVDPVALVTLRDLGQNVRLQSGDLVMVNPRKAASTVYVIGEVKDPGPYELGETDGPLEALLRAGGPTEFASLRRVRLIRRNQAPIELDLSRGADASLIPALEEGDKIEVVRNPNQVLVLNAVAKPGYYPIPEGGQLTVGDALLAAGGPRGVAKDVALVRQNQNGVAEARTIPVGAVAKGNLALNEALMPGDIVYVPESKTTRGGLRNALGTVGALGGILRFFF